MNLDIGYTSDAYVARNGDILILSSFKPRIVEDLLHCGATLVMVVSSYQHQTELRIKVLRKINTEERETKFKYAAFATNIMTNTRIWNARFKNQVDAPEDDDHVDASHGIDNSKVSESFLLMKFYTLSSGVAKHLLHLWLKRQDPKSAHPWK